MNFYPIVPNNITLELKIQELARNQKELAEVQVEIVKSLKEQNEMCKSLLKVVTLLEERLFQLETRKK